MFDRLDQMEARYEELGQQLADPALVSDQKKYSATARLTATSSLSLRSSASTSSVKQGVADAQDHARRGRCGDQRDGPGRAACARAASRRDGRGAEGHRSCPRIPNDDKNIIIELRAGTGGDEAACFVSEMFRTYLRFAEQHKWKVQVLSTSETGIGGGMKEVTAIFEGDKVYSQMKYESGVHRVQRVPPPRPRVACTPLQSPWRCFQAEEVDIKIEQKDLRIGHFLLLRPRRTVGQHDVLGDPHHALADEHRRELSG